ncbi:MAG: c-type cytochrome [Alphaproteobacteria bacterium]
MKFMIKTALVACLMVPMFGGASIATEADDAIKYRKAIMEVVGGHTGAFFAILQQKVPHSDALAYHAQALADASARALVAFEQNTQGEGSEKTTAAAAVWEDWDGFAEKMEAFQTAAEAMAVAAASGDMAAIGPAAGPLGGSCKACHDDYRTK